MTIPFMFGIDYLVKIRKCHPKVMNVHLQPWITFENNLGNWIFSTDRIQDHPLKV